MSQQQRNLKNLHEMVFIYNAVMDGWTVRKLRNGKIRLKKKTKNRERHRTSNSEEIRTRQYDLDLVRFIQNNTQIERIFN